MEETNRKKRKDKARPKGACIESEAETEPLKKKESREEMTAVPIDSMECETFQECEEWYNIFKAIDTDNDGYVPAIELQAALRDSAYTFGLDADQADELINNVDANKDDMVDFSEFSALMAKAKKMRVRRIILYAARSVLPRSQQTKSTRYLLQYNCFPPPLFLFIISLIQIGVYFFYAIKKGEWSALGPVPTDSWMILDPHKKEQIWRYFTYQFIHIGFIHLLSNLAVQILLGIPLELVHKFWRIGLVYTLGVMSGALLFFVFDTNIYLAGASGGVYTLLSAHIANVIINWGEMQFNWIRALVLTLFVSTDVAVALYQRYIEKTPHKVSYISHVGGFIAGLLLGIVILRNLRLKSWEKYAYWIALGVFISYVVVCAIVILSYSV